MAYLHGKFVWFEHLSGDVPKARAFYEALFGWRTVLVPSNDPPYAMIFLGDAAIGGYLTPPPGGPRGWMPYLSVDDVDAAVGRATAAGAQVMRPPENYGNHGRAAPITDPQGAMLTLWRGANGDRADPTAMPKHDWCWTELHSPDPDAAVAFYVAAFGLGHRTVDMGPGGIYHLLTTGEVQRAGVGPKADAAEATAWLPYVAVADCDDAADKARSLGATIAVPPTEIPGIGRYAVLVDPLDVRVAITRLVPPTGG